MTSVAEDIERLRLDRAHGASWLAREAVRSLARAAEARPAETPAEFLAYVRRTARALASARPSMAPLANLVAYVLDRVVLASQGTGIVALRRATRSAAEDAVRFSEEATLDAAANAREHLRGAVLTHSYSATVIAALVGAKARVGHVLVTESRPLYEGRAMAQELAVAGLKVSLITDAQAGVFVPQAQAVVVGADSVLEDGSVVNKAGTCLLALAARTARVPLYVICETAKIAPWPADTVQLEEKDAREVAIGLPPDVQVRNVYFDRTPARLVTALVTEQGTLDRREVRRLARQHRRRFAALSEGLGP